jgi:hypothetical protein
MKIPIIDALETQQQWLTFSAQKTPYAYINSPLTLVDFQSSFLQITQLKHNLRDGRQAKKYSVGDRTCEQAAWSLIEHNQWSLKKILVGLNTLNFSSNVRDNSILKAHSNITVREFFAKEKCIISPRLLQQLTPLVEAPQKWQISDIERMISHQQYSDLKWLSKDDSLNNIKAIVLQLISYPDSWQINIRKEQIILSQHRKFVLQLKPSVSTNTDKAITPSTSKPLLLQAL